MMEEASASKMLVIFYQVTWGNNPEESPFHTHWSEKLKSMFIILYSVTVTNVITLF
jgi:hypothetical protein